MRSAAELRERALHLYRREMLQKWKYRLEEIDKQIPETRISGFVDYVVPDGIRLEHGTGSLYHTLVLCFGFNVQVRETSFRIFW